LGIAQYEKDVRWEIWGIDPIAITGRGCLRALPDPLAFIEDFVELVSSFVSETFADKE